MAAEKAAARLWNESLAEGMSPLDYTSEGGKSSRGNRHAVTFWLAAPVADAGGHSHRTATVNREACSGS
jgi:hypothetical protein